MGERKRSDEGKLRYGTEGGGRSVLGDDVVVAGKSGCHCVPEGVSGRGWNGEERGWVEYCVWRVRDGKSRA